jgi:predicted acyl esterase
MATSRPSYGGSRPYCGCDVRADTYDVVVQRVLEVPILDGVKLLADHYAPRRAGKRPTLLVRSPYGRRAFFGLQFGRLFAERGFQVLVQSVPGTAKTLVPADQSVFHDPAHPSALVLPVLE